MRLDEVIAVLEKLAPPSLAESWDNVGLLFGERDGDVSRILTCLTLTPDVADEAVQMGAQLVVTHHPILFKAVQRLTSDAVEGRTLLTLARHNIAVYSPHTAWDNAPLGINQQLAETLELTDIKPLRPQSSPEELIIVTFVPAAQLSAVQQAVWSAGAGVIGNYRNCSFVLEGMGTFFGTDAANPAVGQAGRLEEVAESRLEFVTPAALLTPVLSALRAAHPYEEPAIDIYPLRSVTTWSKGSGRSGKLAAPASLEELAQRVQQRLPGAHIELVGDPAVSIKRLGIACGAAAEYWKDAQRQWCQALLTGEARFHASVEVRDAGFAMILAGHYATERPGMERLAELLSRECPGVAVSASAAERDPLQTRVDS
jgi:dinuclear metal center YbgI/SA1388 family protein